MYVWGDAWQNLRSLITLTDIMAKSSSDINTVTVTLATSVAVLLMSNGLLFIMGCVCGHYLCQKCRKLANRDTRRSQLQPVPVYENLQLKIMTVDEQEVELERMWLMATSSKLEETFRQATKSLLCSFMYMDGGKLSCRIYTYLEQLHYYYYNSLLMITQYP